MAETKRFKLAYFTVKAPLGRGEAFIITEITELQRRGDVELLIFPLRPDKAPVHGKEAEALAARTVGLPLISGKIVLGFLESFLRSPVRTLGVILKILRNSRPGVVFKNLIVIPKGVYLSRVLKQRNIDHIHAHWASTPSTLAYVVSQLANIPWSFTAHRWDIAENNMLKEKVRTACFVRAIDERGRQEILSIAGGEFHDKVTVIHMGIRIQEMREGKGPKLPPVIACIANLVRVKGHPYLLEACHILKQKGFQFKCLIVGDGPERRNIEAKIRELALNDVIELRGLLPHPRVQELLQEVDILVLPSIVTEEGEKEGIPVVLMEAMSYGVPVVSTRTGGIPELVTEGAGILVEEKDPRRLAQALESLFQNAEMAREIGEHGYRRIKEAFDVSKSVDTLLERIKGT